MAKHQRHWDNLDRQIAEQGEEFLKIGVPLGKISVVASTVADEVITNRQIALNMVDKALFPSLAEFYKEIVALEQFGRTIRKVKDSSLSSPFIERGLVIHQSYMCFVYIRENLILIFRRFAPRDGVIRILCDYLLTNKVKHIRNAIAHGKWSWEFSPDAALIYTDKDVRVKIDNSEFQLLSSCALCLTYVILTELRQFQDSI